MRVRLTILMLFLLLANVQANDSVFFREEDSMKTIIGPVQDIKMPVNRLYVEDELTQETFDFFVHDNELKVLKVGDRVRVNYRSLREPALSVLKMTEVPYDKKDRNKGYLLHRE